MGSKRGGAKIILSLGLIVLAGALVLNRQNLQDQIVLARYSPPGQIQELARNVDFSQRGQNLFYVNEPELRTKQTFNEACGGIGDEQTNVLGCFNGSRIYLFKVDDTRLDGVEEVTAAHEMLHAAYMRLGSSEKQRVDSLIGRQLQTRIEPHIRELITLYERIEPGELNNEMHSILATEQQSLLPELEEYFSQYFDDRQKVVAYSDAYREVFDGLQRRQESLAGDLDRLALAINSGTAGLNARITAYNGSVEAFNRRARSGSLQEAEFNRQRSGLEVESAAIESAITLNEQQRGEYERKRKEFTSLSGNFAELQQQIDSSPETPESVES